MNLQGKRGISFELSRALYMPAHFFSFHENDQKDDD